MPIDKYLTSRISIEIFAICLIPAEQKNDCCIFINDIILPYIKTYFGSVPRDCFCLHWIVGYRMFSIIWYDVLYRQNMSPNFPKQPAQFNAVVFYISTIKNANIWSITIHVIICNTPGFVHICFQLRAWSWSQGQWVVSVLVHGYFQVGISMVWCPQMVPNYCCPSLNAICKIFQAATC